MVPVIDLWGRPERARRGDRDAAIAVMRQAVDELHQAGRPFYGVWGTGVLVQTLLERGAEGDLAEAQEAIDRLANLRADQGSAMLDITLLRLRALLARARGDDIAYRDLLESLPRHGGIAWLRRHIAWAEAMVEAVDWHLHIPARLDLSSLNRYRSSYWYLWSLLPGCLCCPRLPVVVGVVSVVAVCVGGRRSVCRPKVCSTRSYPA